MYFFHVRCKALVFIQHLLLKRRELWWGKEVGVFHDLKTRRVDCLKLEIGSGGGSEALDPHVEYLQTNLPCQNIT